jgi:invasion protein IalB
MDHRIVSASARPVVRTIAAVTTASIVAAVATSLALAQQPPAVKPPAAAPAKPPAAAPAKPAAAAPAKPAGTQAAPEEKIVKMPQLMYSEWIKFCIAPGQGTDGEASGTIVGPGASDPNAQQVCLTGIDGRMESGMPIVAVVAIEPSTGDGKKVLRLTLPVGMHIQHGTRFIIDQGTPLTAPYVTCFPNGCISDYELTADVLGKMKKGKAAVVQGINYDGSAISVPVPLTEFAKAHDGPPTDPQVLAERQKKLEEELKRKGEELQKKAEEAREKLEQGQAQPPAKPQ